MSDFNTSFQNKTFVDYVDTKNIHKDIKQIGENLLEGKSIFDSTKTEKEESNSDSVELSKKGEEE